MCSQHKYYGPIWSSISNSHFQILNNVTHISTHFFTHTYFKKLQTIILKLLYQTPPIYVQMNPFQCIHLNIFQAWITESMKSFYSNTICNNDIDLKNSELLYESSFPKVLKLHQITSLLRISVPPHPSPPIFLVIKMQKPLLWLNIL